ncbi:hypothetical protein [Vagococcus fluvialis]|uniref:Uncharacterized protein n=1 Tax=Vagococcus fluvialis TaxID=2738 RepID=A0A7X6I3F4_9ENTE|nr:hypothetical protein [Vagococcus fluvialis]NKC68421.1 hypothetical protein [Vagococcus fluvialis]
MKFLQWLLIIGIATTIISLILALYFLFCFIKQNKIISKEVIRGNDKRKKAKKLLKHLKQKRQKNLNNTLLFFLLVILLGSGSFYISYYQATNLSDDDMANISDGFYYLSDIQDTLEGIKSKEIDKESSQQTINYVLTSLAGYSVKKANRLNTIEGQRVLNKYYNAMAELGLNISRKSINLFTDEGNVDECLSDLEKVQIYQRKTLDFFKIDSSALEAKK